MQDFEFFSPEKVDEAVKLLSEKGVRARPLAGGTDLLIHLRNKVLVVDRVVDVKKIPELNQLTLNGDGLTLGAATPCHRIYENAEIKSTYQGVYDSAFLIGGIQIQGRASFGGNICNAAPSGDTIPSIIAHEGVCVISGPKGTRQIKAEDFCTGPRENVLEEGELLISIKFPRPRAHFGAHYLRFIPRNEMDIAVAGVGASVVLAGDRIESVRIALASVAPRPVLADEAMQVLEGKKPTEDLIEEAAEVAKKAANPIDDMRGSAKQRIHLVGVLTKRALREAISRAKGA